MFPLGVGFGTRRGGFKARGRRGGWTVGENPGEGGGQEGLATKRPPSPYIEGEEPGGGKDEGDGRVDVRFTMYPVARSRGKAGVEGDGQWKVTVLVTWLRHGHCRTTLSPLHFSPFLNTYFAIFSIFY